MVFGLATILPSVDILLEIAGSILGTIVNIVIPVLFYNRAYSGELRHLQLECPRQQSEAFGVSLNEARDGEIEEDANPLIGKMEKRDEEELEPEDTRQGTRYLNWAILVVGIVIGSFGLF